MIANLYKYLSNVFQKVFNNMDIYDIVRSLDNTGIKSIIYNIFTELLDKQTFIADEEELYTHKDLLIKEFRNIEELDIKKICNFLIENSIIKKYEIIIFDVYYIYGYLLLNEINIDKIKNYNDEQIIIFIKNIYTELIFNFFEKFINKFLNIFNTDNLNLKTDDIIKDIKIKLEESKKLYEEINKL